MCTVGSEEHEQADACIAGGVDMASVTVLLACRQL